MLLTAPEAAARHVLAKAEGKIAVACSGGGDSLAALQLLWEAAPERISAVTVDHRLRPEAAEEARAVGRFCAARGMAHTTLVWHWQSLEGNVSALARQARYGLICNWAKAAGISHIVVAHSQEDVAESLLLSLGRAGGLEGLARMKAHWQQEDISFHRPFLATARADLREALRLRGLDWAEDPSNQDPHYARVRMRALLPALEAAGVAAAHMARSAENLSDAAEALAWSLSRDFGAFGTPAGEAVFEIGLYLERPKTLRLGLLRGLCHWIAGGYAPRGEELLRLDQALLQGELRRSLGGCLFTRSAKRLRVSREFVAIRPWQGGLFDARWCLKGTLAADQFLAPLGAEGLKALQIAKIPNVSRDAAIATPAVWCDRRVLAAPVLGLENGFSFTLKTDLAKSLLSH